MDIYPQGFFDALKVNFNPTRRGTRTMKAFLKKWLPVFRKKCDKIRSWSGYQNG